MKKNKWMRFASALLVLCLLSTCVIGGTFAKYTTADTAEDTARVAKFGVIVTASGTLFSNAYVAAERNTPTTWTEEAQADAITVQTAEKAGDNLVAPGTQSSEALSFQVTGTPEVAVEVSAEITSEDIYLAAGTYATDEKGTNAVTVAEDYYPVKYTFGETTGKASDVAASVAGKLGDVSTKDNTIKGTKKYAVNTELDDEFAGTITWEWEYEDEDITNVNVLDTILGNLMAETGTYYYKTADNTYTKLTVADNTVKAGETTVGYLQTSFNIAITVTQID